VSVASSVSSIVKSGAVSSPNAEESVGNAGGGVSSAVLDTDGVAVVDGAIVGTVVEDVVESAGCVVCVPVVSGAVFAEVAVADELADAMPGGKLGFKLVPASWAPSASGPTVPSVSAASSVLPQPAAPHASNNNSPFRSVRAALDGRCRIHGPCGDGSSVDGRSWGRKYVLKRWAPTVREVA
jgi:hypothetical protein